MGLQRLRQVDASAWSLAERLSASSMHGSTSRVTSGGDRSCDPRRRAYDAVNLVTICSTTSSASSATCLRGRGWMGWGTSTIR